MWHERRELGEIAAKSRAPVTTAFDNAAMRAAPVRNALNLPAVSLHGDISVARVRMSPEPEQASRVWGFVQAGATAGRKAGATAGVEAGHAVCREACRGGPVAIP